MDEPRRRVSNRGVLASKGLHHASPKVIAARARLRIHGGTTHDGKTVEQLDFDTMLNFGRSVMTIAAADGEVSGIERDTFLGMMAFGVPPTGLEITASFDPRGKRLEDYRPREHRSMIRHFLYDAIKVARVALLRDGH